MMEFLTALLILVTGVYVFFTYRIGKANEQAVTTMREQLEATKDAAEATLVRVFLDDYFDPVMSEALRRLQEWQEQNGDGFASTWLTRLRARDATARDVDQASRHVKAYFEKAARIFSAGLIRPKILQQIAYVAGLNIYYDVIDSLERELNPDRRDQTIELLQYHCGRYKEGAQIRSVPPKSDATQQA